jgi:hypothetical protein
MTIKIPLPWYSRTVYDPANDQVSGGWRYAYLHVNARRSNRFHAWSCEMSMAAGIGAWIRSRSLICLLFGCRGIVEHNPHVHFHCMRCGRREQ